MGKKIFFNNLADLDLSLIHIYVIPIDDAVKYLKEGIEKTYKKKGQHIVCLLYTSRCV